MIFYQLFSIIAQVVFKLVTFIFVLIDDIAKYNFFRAETINEFTSRVYVIIGVLMLFKLVISAIQYIVNPDMFDDKSKGLGAVLRKAIIAVVLLAVVPAIFTFAMEVQGAIVEQLPKIIFGNQEYSVESTSERVSMTIMDGFLNPKSGHTPTKKLNSVDDFNAVATDGCGGITLLPASWLNAFTGEWCHYDLMVLLSPIAAVFLVYILGSMALDIATRTIKLGIVQILAPIPITSYIVDEKKLTTWATTAGQIYADLFIRMGSIYLVIYIIQKVVLDMFTASGYENLTQGMAGATSRIPSTFEMALVKLIIIAALLLFAKNAPKFISDLLGLKGAGEGIGDMFKRAGGLFGTTMSGIRTARSNYTTQKERVAGKGYGRGRQIAAGLRSAVAGVASSTGRGMLMAGQGKGFKDVREGAFKQAIEARNRRIDREDNLYDEEYGWKDYRRDVRREKLGIPSSEGFIKTRYDAMQNIAKIAADSKSHGVGKMNETPNRYSIAFGNSDINGKIDLSGSGANESAIRSALGYSSLSLSAAQSIYDVAKSGGYIRAQDGSAVRLTNDQLESLAKLAFKDNDFRTIHDALGYDSLTMEQARNMYNMARNGNKVKDAKGKDRELTSEELNALGSMVQSIEKRTSYLKEAELMGTGDPAASPNVDKLVMAMKSNKSMFSSPEIMAPILEKVGKYGVKDRNGNKVDNIDQLISVVEDLQAKLDRKNFASDEAYFKEVDKRADVLTFVKDSFEEISKQQYKSAEIAASRAKKAQQAINNDGKKS